MDDLDKSSVGEDPDTVDQLLDIKRDYRIEYQCANCILEFTKHVIAYLYKKNFLIIENDTIFPTPLGKAAFASSISPEESQKIFKDLLNAR